MTWTTNHYQATGCVWSVSQSRHHATPVCHIWWQLSAATANAVVIVLCRHTSWLFIFSLLKFT